MGLAWFSNQETKYRAQHSSDSSQASPYSFVPSIGIKRDLIEVLDRIVTYENYYHSVYGHFTQLLNKIGFVVPKSVSDIYDIRVTEYSDSRLLVIAMSESNGRVLDLISIDERFHVHANFDIPLPRAAYLKSQAIKNLRAMKETTTSQNVSEDGIFKGYFQYSVRDVSPEGKSAFAVGVRPPVVGLQLELTASEKIQASFSSEASSLTDLMDDLSDTDERIQTGQRSSADVSHLEEEAYLAQQIYRGEVGRYAKSWSELSKIANFKFQASNLLGLSTQSPFEGRPPSEKTTNGLHVSIQSLDSDLESEPESDSPRPSAGRNLTRGPDRRVSTSIKQKLEFEPIDSKTER